MQNKTPVEIDTELARIYGEIGQFEARARYLMKAKTQSYLTEAQVVLYDEQIDEIEAKINDLRVEAMPLEVEFQKAPWTRAWLVTDGHVHRTTGCSTCFPTTQFYWLVQLSGSTEDQIVEQAGERACTVCYPSAPVNVLKYKSVLFTPDEVERAKAKLEREQAAAERQRKAIANAPTADGTPLTVRTTKTWEVFKTERAADMWVVGHLSNSLAYGYSLDSEAVNLVVAALATKHGVSIDDELARIDAKADAKAKRDKKESEKHARALGLLV